MKRILIAGAAALALVITGCQQDEIPSADEIANATMSKENEREISALHTQLVDTLNVYGTVSESDPAGKKIAYWGQTDANYIFEVNSQPSSGSSVRVKLPAGFTWVLKSDKPDRSKPSADINLYKSIDNEYSFAITKDSNGYEAIYEFSYKKDVSRIITGTLKVTTAKKPSAYAFGTLRTAFEYNQGLSLYPNSTVYRDGVIADEAVDQWGQVNAQYTITNTTGYVSLTLWKFADDSIVEWYKETQPSTGAEVGKIYPEEDTTQDGYSVFTFSNPTATVKTGILSFTIKTDAHTQDPSKVIQGKIYVRVSSSPMGQVTTTLQTLQTAFNNWPSRSQLQSTGGTTNYVSTFWAKDGIGINAWSMGSATAPGVTYYASITVHQNATTLALTLPQDAGLTWKTYDSTYGNTAKKDGLTTRSDTTNAMGGITPNSLGALTTVSLQNISSTITAPSQLTLDFTAVDTTPLTSPDHIAGTIYGKLILTIISVP